MKIHRKSVRKVARYVHPTLEDKYVRVISTFESLDDKSWDRLSLSKPLEEGESYLPPPVGRFSRFNAEGRWIVRRGEPKERRYITTIWTRRSEFRGRDHREEVEAAHDVHRMCYPRDPIPPPENEIFGFRVDDKVYAATEAVPLPSSSERLQHQVNLMLELFGECEIVRADGQSASPAKTTRRWTFLPPGPYKSGEIAEAIKPILENLRSGDQLIVADRQDFMEGLDPQEVARGEGGFNDYLAYVFPQHGKVILESIRRDNAIYIFDGAWEAFSRLTKRQIIDQKVHKARIVHSTGWKSKVLNVLKS